MRLNYSTYANILYEYIKSKTQNKELPRLLLAAGCNRKGDYNDITKMNKSQAHRIFTGKDKIPDYILHYYYKPGFFTENTPELVVKHLEDNLHWRFANDNDVDNLLKAFNAVIEKDKDIPQEQRSILLALACKATLYKFLAETFIYAVKQKNEPYKPIFSVFSGMHWEFERVWSSDINMKTDDGFSLSEGGKTLLIRNDYYEIAGASCQLQLDTHSEYGFSVDVKMTGFERYPKDIIDHPNQTGGAGPIYQCAKGDEIVAYSTVKQTLPDWKTVYWIVTTNSCTSYILHLRNGEGGNACKGTAYFKNLVYKKTKAINTPRADREDSAQITNDTSKLQDKNMGYIHRSNAHVRVSNLPIQNQFFTGRKEILAELSSSFFELKVPIQILSGMGGVGKSQTAWQYAFLHTTDYTDAIWWIRASSSLVNDIKELSVRFGFPESDNDDRNIQSFMQDWYQRYHSWLLIFDNAESYRMLSQYLPSATRGHVIITTRDNNDFSRRIKQINVEVFTEAESIDFLAKHDIPVNNLARNLSNRLGRLPLALEQAAAYMNQNTKSSAKYIEMLENHGLKMFEEGQPPDYNFVVNTTWDITFNKLSEPARDLMFLCAHLSPNKIPISLFVDGEEFLPNTLRGLFSYEFDRNKVFSELTRYSLLKAIDEDTYSLHVLLQAAVVSKDNNYAHLYSCLNIVTKILSTDFNIDKNEKLLDTYLPHCKHVLASVERMENRNDQATSLFLSADKRLKKWLHFSIILKVRLVGQSSWENAITANPGDTLEYLISYSNTSETDHFGVVVRDFLPKNMVYVPGSVLLFNSNNPDGLSISDSIFSNGSNIGNYAGTITGGGTGSNAYVMFQATVPSDDNLEYSGINTLRNYGIINTKYGGSYDCIDVYVVSTKSK